MKLLNCVATVLLLLVCEHDCSFADGGEKGGYIVAVDSRSVPDVIELPSSRDIKLDLPLGEWTGEFFIITNPPQGSDWKTLRVEQRNKRCLGISAEGPHLDFRDWKGDATPWREMRRVQFEKWKGASFTDADFPGFPEYSIAEVETEVRKILQGFEEDPEPWLKLARQCKSDIGTCHEMHCETEIRFVVTKEGKQSTVRTIRMLLPMGC